MEILSYLAEVVKTRKEVGIPGLGTFFKKKSPGRYDAGTHSFVPPSFSLDFTTEVREHTALIDFISQKKNISADSSSYFLGQFAEGLLAELDTKGTANLGKLGVLRKTDDGLSFDPDINAAVGFDFYGLPNVKDEQTAPTDPLLESITEENEIAPAETYSDAVEPGEAQLDLEDHNADLGDGEATYTEPEQEEEAMEEEVPSLPEEEEDPVYEEIAEVDHHAYQPVPEPPVYVETVENLEEEEEDELENESSEIQELQLQPVPEQAAPSEEKPSLVKRPDEYIPVNPENQETGSVWTFYNSNTPGETSTVENTERKPFPLYLKLLIAIAVLAAVVAALYFTKPELFESKPVPQIASVPNDSTTVNSTELKADSIALADSIKNAEALLLEDTLNKDTVQIQPTPAASSATVVTETEVAKPNKDLPLRYEILAASLANKTEADNFLAQMKRRGIKAKIADLPGRKFKITLGTFTDEEAAKKALVSLKESTKIPDIYIFRVKHTNTNHK
ncbi:SPOR domain-containing protein [Pedobacter sp. GR22-6]|uniref:SPOR domain-containing protein n=1 Tax=Pedobacter sp. GR22-6 TaxID=3127957 RepID=UPI00307F9597